MLHGDSLFDIGYAIARLKYTFNRVSDTNNTEGPDGQTGHPAKNDLLLGRHELAAEAVLDVAATHAVDGKAGDAVSRICEGGLRQAYPQDLQMATPGTKPDL